MMKIWKRTDNEAEVTRAIVSNIDDIRAHGIAYMTGKPLSVPFPETQIEIRTDHPPDDYFVAGIGMPVVSDKVRSVLEEFTVSAEFFLLRVLFDGSEFHERKYYFMNITELVEVLDFENGKYTFWEKPGFEHHVDKILKLAIDDTKVGSHSLFRLANGAEYLIGVSDEIANRLSNHNLTGMKFIDPDNYRFC